MRTLRAIYNRARKSYRELPPDNSADIGDCSQRPDNGIRLADRPAGTESRIMSKRPTGIPRYDQPAAGWDALTAAHHVDPDSLTLSYKSVLVRVRHLTMHRNVRRS